MRLSRLFTSLPPLPVSLGVLVFLLTVNILGASKVSRLQVAIVAVPDSFTWRLYGRQHRELADHSYEIGTEIHLQVAFHDLLTHNAKEAVHRQAVGSQAKWIVLERPKRQELHFLVRTPFSWWVQHAPCNVAIFSDRGAEFDGHTSDDFKKNLVFLCKKARSSQFLNIANHLGRQQKQYHITLVTTRPDDENNTRAKELEAWHAELTSLCHVSSDSRVIPTNDVINTICELGRTHDLLVLDISEEWCCRSLFVDYRNKKIADRASCSVLQIKSNKT